MSPGAPGPKPHTAVILVWGSVVTANYGVIALMLFFAVENTLKYSDLSIHKYASNLV